MRIAVLAPPYLPVPPTLYGGTEKIVSLLTEGLVQRGHDVTLFASGDSKTTAKLASIFPKAIGNSGLTKNDITKPLAHYAACYDRASEFDIIHSHGQYVSLKGALGVKTPVVFTWHGSFYSGETTDELRTQLHAHKEFNFISISHNQRGGLPDLTYVATVYNALNISEYTYVPQRNQDYLLWVGRMSPKKGAHEAIMAAKKSGIRLEMAATIDPINREYFENTIKPLIDGVTVVYHGEVGHDALVELYGGARAVLYPISWHEPFGLVMIESMACGTPVIAYDLGSVSEVISDGVTGFVVPSDSGVDGIVGAIINIKQIDRKTCRSYVEERFTSERMVSEYEMAYEKVIAGL